MFLASGWLRHSNEQRGLAHFHASLAAERCATHTSGRLFLPEIAACPLVCTLNGITRLCASLRPHACALLQARSKRGARWWQAATRRLLVIALLACALPEASGSRGLRAASNWTEDWDDVAEAAQNVTGPLALLHPRLVVFGDSISSIRGTSLVVRKALRLTHMVRMQPGLEHGLPPLGSCTACLHADSTAFPHLQAH